MRFLILIPLFFFSCKTPNLNLFTSKNLHEQYGKKISDAGLQETAMGRAWFAAAERALKFPQTVSIPYKEVGYFPADKPRAVGLRFSAKRGEKINFQINKNPSTGFVVYADLWNLNEQNQTSLITSIDTTKNSFEHEVSRDGSFLLRLQPELLKSGDYTLTISIGPTLKYPVGDAKAKVGSFWGAARDGGARKHEGIDIFASRGTPTVAAADGVITSVSENKLGGKVIFMRPYDKDYSLYYAHLDQQLASSGDRVKAGDKIGTVGNTGNAATSSPHLHFGIYAPGGAIDPFPFVNPAVRKPAEVSFDPQRLRAEMRLRSDVKLQNFTYKANTVVFPVAASAKEFRVETPDGALLDVPASSIMTSVAVIKQAKIKENAFLKEAPTTGAPRVASVANTANLKILGYFNDFTYVQNEAGTAGWIESNLIR